MVCTIKQRIVLSQQHKAKESESMLLETMLLETIEDNKKKYSADDVKKAERARQLQHLAGHVSYTALMKIAKENMLKVTVQ